MSDKTKITLDCEPGKTYLVIVPPLGEKMAEEPKIIENPMVCTATGTLTNKDCDPDSAEFYIP